MATPKKPTIGARVASVGLLATSKLFNSTPAPASPQTSKIGMSPGPLNRNVAQAVTPNASTFSQRMSAKTYFTQAPIVGQSASQVLYEADRLWARVTLVLETAGPVAVGFDSSLGPVTSGKGILLTTDVPLVMDIPKGNKLYIQATAANRVKVIVQSVPWLEQITGLVLRLTQAMGIS